MASMGGGTAGFAGATTNAFTLGVAQGISGLPMFSALGYHIICLVCFTALLCVLLLWYAKRLEKDQSRSLMYEQDKIYAANNEVDFSQLPEFTTRRKIILVTVLLTLAVMNTFPWTSSSRSVGSMRCWRPTSAIEGETRCRMII